MKKETKEQTALRQNTNILWNALLVTLLIKAGYTLIGFKRLKTRIQIVGTKNGKQHIFGCGKTEAEAINNTYYQV